MELDQKTMVNEIERAIEDGDYECNDWEKEFFHEMIRRRGQDFLITPKQDAALERLWKKATGK